jgi:outer membrane protein TolC
VYDNISVVQAQANLESVQAQAINVGLLRAQYEHAIAMLIGRPASSFSIPVKPKTTAAADPYRRALATAGAAS